MKHIYTTWIVCFFLLFSLNTYAQNENPCDCPDIEDAPSTINAITLNNNTNTTFNNQKYLLSFNGTINNPTFVGDVTLIIAQNSDIILSGNLNYNNLNSLTISVLDGGSFKMSGANINNRVFKIFNEGSFEFDGSNTVNLGASSHVFNGENAFFLSDGEFNIQSDNNLNNELSGQIINLGKIIFDKKINILEDMDVCNRGTFVNDGQLSMNGIFRNTGDLIITGKYSSQGSGITYNCGRLRTTRMDDLRGDYYNYCLTILDTEKLAIIGDANQVFENHGFFVINRLFEVGTNPTVRLKDLSRVYASGFTLNSQNKLYFEGTSFFNRSVPTGYTASTTAFLNDCPENLNIMNNDVFDIIGFSDTQKAEAININGSPKGESDATLYICNFTSDQYNNQEPTLLATNIDNLIESTDCSPSGFLITGDGNTIERFTSNLKKSTIFTSTITNLDFTNDCKSLTATLELATTNESPALSNYKVAVPSDITVSNIQVTYGGSSSSIYPTASGNTATCLTGTNGAITFQVTTIGSGFNGFKIDDFLCVDNCIDENEVDCDFGSLTVTFDLEQADAFEFNNLVINVDPTASNASSNFDFIRLACDNIIPDCDPILVTPVQLTSFNAKKNEDSVLLEWETASETNSKLYEVQHSIDGISYQKLGDVHSYGNSERLIAYSFTHDEVVKGVNFYRLKQVDFNGDYEYSKVEYINFDPSEEMKLMLYPQPNTSQLFIKNLRQKTTAEVTVKIYDLTGNLILSDHILSQKNRIDTSSLRAGIYIVKIKYDGKTESFKMIKAASE